MSFNPIKAAEIEETAIFRMIVARLLVNAEPETGDIPDHECERIVRRAENLVEAFRVGFKRHHNHYRDGEDLAEPCQFCEEACARGGEGER